MRENLKKRINLIEGKAEPTKPMIIICSADENLEDKIAEWEALEGVPSANKPLIILDGE